ncbi:uncharacterized protein [Physcomitrium patens]|uniref:uncharacterized protein isoform X3 n=1 Tax=Physcomitrium patens TaxID=3218 RepID=UPI003CCDA80A
MRRLGHCFRYGRCSCIVCEGEEAQESGEEETAFANPAQIRTPCMKTCANSATMDVHSSAPFASSSSVRSTSISESNPTLEEIQLAYQKLHSLTSTSSPRFIPASGAGVICSSTYPHSGGSVAGFCPWASCSISNSGSYDCPHSVPGAYFTPKEIAYRGPLSTGSNTPTLSNLTSNLACNVKTLQKLVQKSSPSKVDPSTGRLMDKLKNLDEILRNLDESLISRKISNKYTTPPPADFKLSDEKYATSAEAVADPAWPKNGRLFRDDAGLSAFADTSSRSLTSPFSSIPNQMPNAATLPPIARTKPVAVSKPEANLGVDPNWPEKRSSTPTHILQSSSPPVAVRELQDNSLLLSNLESVTTHNPGAACTEDKANMKKLMDHIALFERRISRRIRCLRRGTRRQQQSGCRVARRQPPTRILQQQLLSTLQQRLSRTDVGLKAVKRQLDQVLVKHHRCMAETPAASEKALCMESASDPCAEASSTPTLAGRAKTVSAESPHLSRHRDCCISMKFMVLCYMLHGLTTSG